MLRNRVLDLRQRTDGQWDVVTEQRTIVAEHVVNAAGLWARRVGRMVGLDLPVVPMSHHYLVTDDVPMLAALGREFVSIIDLEGFTYLQPLGKGALLGVYERDPRHWSPEGAPWDYGMDLLPPDVERILPELEIGYARFPALAEVGIKRWVNGAFTFTPDGNPLVGPVSGKRNLWVACGCMGGFSQGGATTTASRVGCSPISTQSSLPCRTRVPRGPRRCRRCRRTEHAARPARSRRSHAPCRR